MILRRTRLDSPVGSLVIVSNETGLVALTWKEGWDADGAALEARFPGHVLVDGDPHAAVEALEAWFGGDLHALDRLPVDTGGTDFQRRVWTALRAIPVGGVRTYGELAAAVGRPGGARAVGGANRANPVSIVIPCHRVVAADGGLGGYAGEWAGRKLPVSSSHGLGRKTWLLAHEGVAIENGRIRR